MRKYKTALAAAAALAMAAISGPAFAMDGYYVTYYADPSYTMMVGAEMMDCSGQHQLLGVQTAYSIVSTWHC